MACLNRITKAAASEPADASSKSRLGPRQAAFVREYLAAGCANAKQAAIRAGYAGGASAEVTASRLLKNPKIAAEIGKARNRLFRRHEVNADRVLREIAAIAYLDPADLFDEQGELLPVRRMPKRGRCAIAAVHFKDGVPRTLSFRDKMKALSILVKKLGLLSGESVRPAPPAKQETVSVEECRRLAGIERKGKKPPSDP